MENSEKVKIKRKFKGYELFINSDRLQRLLLPPNVSLEEFSFENQPYFEKYGFKVPKYYSQIYQKSGCINSEKYIPPSLYFFYINPFLLNLNFSNAYTDKNAYDRLYPSIKQPKCYIHSVNNKILTAENNEFISKKEAAKILIDKKFIIKPAIDSGMGRDVELILPGKTETEIINILNNYNTDFIVQEVLNQHSDLLKLNPSSLNTLRVYTFLPVGAKEHVLLGAAVRFGGKGDHRDNACAGGGFCKVHEDGFIDDKICQYQNWEPRSLKKEKGITHLKFPSYNEAIEKCLKLHKSVPYMDLIGWDIAINNDGEPTLIELNQYPDCEFIQLFNGPMFGEYTDDLMEAISKYKTKFIDVMQRSFDHGNPNNVYNFEIGRKHTL